MEEVGNQSFGRKLKYCCVKKMVISDNQKIACTLDGERWLASALDPFHDTNLDLTGLPDLNSGPSFVSMLTQSITVSSPNVSNPTWTCNIGFLPLNKVGTGRNASLVAGVFPPSADSFNFLPQYNSGTNNDTNGGPINVNVYSSATGNDPASYVPVAFSLAQPQFSKSFGDTSGTPCRVISMGFEVTDTTPTLYQQGSLTAYRVPYNENFMTINAQNNNALGTIVTLGMDAFGGCPTSIDGATALDGSRTWDAKSGVYMVGHLEDPTSCKAFGYYAGNRVAITNPDVGIVYGGNVAPSSLIEFSFAGGTNGFALGGVSIRGLNGINGSLRITARIIYEYFPRCTLADPFITLSSPSAPYDAKAFESYAHASRSLPVAVPVRMNAAGDWFRMAVKAAHESGLAGMIHPLLGVGIGSLNSVVNRNVAKPMGKPRRKKMRARRVSIASSVGKRSRAGRKK